jgi:hypothetical protein
VKDPATGTHVFPLVAFLLDQFLDQNINFEHPIRSPGHPQTFQTGERKFSLSLSPCTFPDASRCTTVGR